MIIDRPMQLLNSSALRRYFVAIVAPASTAAAQFLLQMVLLKTADAVSFGILAFILGLVQFSYGLCNALVATPYTVIRNQGDGSPRALVCLFQVNLVLALLCGLACAGSVVLFGHAGAALGFFAAGMAAMLRWFARSYLYAEHALYRVALSDLCYAGALALLAIVGAACGLALDMVAWSLCAASLVGLCVVGPSFLRHQFFELGNEPLSSYAAVWRQQSRWMLVGVASTETVFNAHSYFVALYAGPAALASIAAAAFLFKPSALVLTSLTQLERPSLSRSFACRDLKSARSVVRRFRAVSVFIWAATTVAGVLVLVLCPRFIFKPSYDLVIITTAFAILSMISLLQSLSTPSNVLLQAAGQFSALARIGVVAAIVSIIAVVAIGVVTKPVLTLFGILLGQALFVWCLASLEATALHADKAPGAPKKPEGNRIWWRRLTLMEVSS